MPVDPQTHLTVTCGATEAMVATLMAIVNPGDEVVVMEPFYENYGPDAILCEAKPVYVPLRPGEPLDLDRLAAAFSTATRAIIVNTPNNPAGRVLTRAELEGIAALCQRHDAWAVTDEIYEHIRYDGPHIPIATLPGMWDRTITISGASKTFSVTGWRIGWIVAPPEVSDAIRKVHDFLTVGRAGAAAGRRGRGARDAARVVLHRHGRGLPAPPRPAGRRPPGGGLQLPAAERALLHPRGLLGASDRTDTEFAHWLTAEIGVASVPGSSFFSEPELGRNFIRFAFCKTDDMLEAAAKRLERLEAGRRAAGGSLRRLRPAGRFPRRWRRPRSSRSG